MHEVTREYEDHGRIRVVTLASHCAACQVGCANYDPRQADCRDCSPADRACGRMP
jgi:hypothetical protein